MNDHELLEVAAKAAGIDLHPKPFFTNGLTMRHGGGILQWNPLTSDGDALRLAVMLDITIRFDDPSAVICGWTQNQDGAPTRDGKGPWYWKEWVSVDGVSDQWRATRRAIVQAAAATLKDKP